MKSSNLIRLSTGVVMGVFLDIVFRGFWNHNIDDITGGSLCIAMVLLIGLLWAWMVDQ